MQDEYEGVNDQELVQPDEQTQQSDDREQRLSDKEYNFRALERSKNAEIARRDDELRQLKEQFDELRRAIQKPAEPEDDEDPEDYARNRKVKGLHQELKEIKQQMEAQRQAQTMERLNSLTSKYSDLNEVVTLENINQLKKLEPELAESLTLQQDPVKKSVAAYKAIQKFVLKSGGESVVKKTPEHASKPRSVLSAPKSAIDSANAFATSADPEALYREMMRYRSGG